jgi:uncharacterized Zn finger protein
MMECKKCGPFDPQGKLRRGLKQVGNTKRDGTRGERIYRCQDCSAVWRLSFDAATKTSNEAPVFNLIEGGKANG